MGLIRLEFDLGQGKIEPMVEILGARTVQNKPKLLDQVRDVIRRRHFSIRTEQADRNRKSQVRAHKSENREQRFLLFDVDLAVEEEQDKRDSEQGSQERLDNPEQEPGEVERLRL